MDLSTATERLSALSQETRLQAFRMLVQAGPEGVPATVIATELGVRRNLMSTHLRILSTAGLTTIRREGRLIYHAADFDAVRALLSFLIEDCCGGESEGCDSMLDALLPLAAAGRGAA